MAPTMTVDALPPSALDADPTLHNPRAAGLAFVVAKGMSALAGDRDKQLRADVAPVVFFPKDTIVVRDPTDPSVTLGEVTMTNPASKAEVTDREAFHQWMIEQYPDQCPEALQPIGTMRQLLDAIIEHCPPEVADRLVTVDRPVAEWAEKAVLTRSAKAGQPIGPGGEMDALAPPGIGIKPGTPAPQVRLAEGAPERIRALWLAGQVVLPAVETGDGHLVIDAPTEDN